ncbi:hypothetical protein ACFL3J_02865 [Candidatus Omnitrophota bacterium]
MKKIITLFIVILAIFGGYTLQDAHGERIEETGTEDVYIEEAMIEGTFWNKMKDRDKFAYLLGYQDGLMTTSAHFISDKGDRAKAMDSFPGGNIDELITKINEFYTNEEHTVIPMCYVLVVLRNRQKGQSAEEVDKYIGYLKESYALTREMREKIEQVTQGQPSLEE